MTEAPGFQHVDGGGHRALVRDDLAAVPLEDLWGTGAPLPAAKGRGGAQVLEVGGVRGVVRDFRRGGALRALLATAYLDPSRPQRELRLLAELRRRGVPVVEPLAALARRCCPLFYRLRLITALVEGAEPLPAFVAARPGLRRAAVREAGRVVGLAFAAGLRHRDLHPDNLVAREGASAAEVDVHLLDLDRATLEPELGPGAEDRMLVRMARYLARHRAALPAVWATDRLRFLAGMGLDRAARRARLRRLGPLYEDELRRHRIAPA